MEETPFLTARHWIIRGIEVEDQLIGRLVKGGNELLEQQLVDIDSNLAINPVLQATKRRLAAQWPSPVRSSSAGRIDTQGLMVVQVFKPRQIP